LRKKRFARTQPLRKPIADGEKRQNVLNNWQGTCTGKGTEVDTKEWGWGNQWNPSGKKRESYDAKDKETTPLKKQGDR